MRQVDGKARVVFDKQPTVWTQKPHTAAKHQILQAYLDAWYPILGFRRGRVLVIDGFAGPGMYANGERGSPILTLERLLDRSDLTQLSGCEFVFLFNEARQDRYLSLEAAEAALREERGGYPPNVSVGTSGRSFDELVTYLLSQVGDRQLAPTFAFLDPFGYKGIAMSRIGELLAAPSCELFAYFDINSAIRFAGKGIVDNVLHELFGTDEFRRAPASGPGREAFLVDLYARQLQQVAGFTYVQHFRMVGANGKPICYLFFATRHLKGLAMMKSAMWKVAPTGTYSFSDKMAGQEVLLGLDTFDPTPLQAALLGRFRGQTVSVEAIHQFVLTETPYLETHFKRQALAPMQREGIISSPNQKKKCTFPAGTIVAFSG